MPSGTKRASSARNRTDPSQQFQRFAERLLRQTKGRWAGQPLALEPYQREIADELLSLDPTTGRRRYREALIGFARKNGKSTLASGLALYMLVVEGALIEPGAEIYAAAASRDQARIVFGQAKEMVLNSPLSDWCDVYRDTISVPSTGALFKVLASDAPKQHGLNPHGGVVDELHAHRDGGDLYFALRTAMLARLQPLLVSITTAGFDPESICYQLYERGLLGEDPSLYFKWYSVADEDVNDPAAWKAANPASWITEADLVRESKSLPPIVFEQLHLNRWTAASDYWLPKGSWDACKGEVKIGKGDKSVVALDMAQKHDTAGALRARFVVDDESPRGWRIHVKAHSFALQQQGKARPKAHTVITHGDSIDFALVENTVRDYARELFLAEVPYDPWQMARSAQLLGDEGIPMVEFPQSNERMCPATQLTFELVAEGLIVHDGDPVLKAHLDAAIAKDTGRGWRLDKKKATRPMDLAICLVMAVARIATLEGLIDSDKRSVYEHRDVLVLDPDEEED